MALGQGKGRLGMLAGGLRTPGTRPPLCPHIHLLHFSLPPSPFWASRLASEKSPRAPQVQDLGFQPHWITVPPKCSAGSKL